MTMSNLDIWDLWCHEAVLILKDSQPVWNETVFVYILPCSDISDDSLLKTINGKLDSNGSKFTLQRDYFINMMFFAASRVKVGMKIFDSTHDAVDVDIDALKELLPAINQLSAIFAYKARIISMEQFAQHMKAQSLFFSTPLGDDDQGNSKLFLCSSSDDNTVYFPVFLTEDHIRAFYQQQHRANYMILTDTLQHILSTLDTNEKLRELGVVIEPLNSCDVAIPPMFRIE